MQHKVIFIMGVSGSGKTTIGHLLSAETGYPFFDADDFHPPANIDKMKSGIALTDADRWPWLDNIHAFVSEQLLSTNLIFACSALKANYRSRLCENMAAQCKWVYLSGDFNTIQNRLQHRSNHYMPPALLQSQFDALEYPTGAIVVNIGDSPENIVQSILPQIN